eukprot:TRINITY_DN945_c0_g1_i1.p5 TRINITY_DN945_c0_g1~~TRINITY_DN945_c0_g1_i1.p5  ORF type:complete len:111 (-),score=24.75 TRINITY_DN945_c0_g1_i1:188-520(-)
MIQKCLPKIKGKKAVIIGDSALIGRPTANLLRRMKANVLVCKENAKKIHLHTSNADIVVVDVRTPKFLDGKLIKPGAVVIDAGMNVLRDPGVLSKRRVVGDIDFESVNFS